MTPAKAVHDPAATSDGVERGRRAYASRAWRQAYESLAAADAESPLAAEDLELLATAAGMVGRDADYLALLERTHHAHLEEGDTLRAVRCAFWVGMYSAIRGDGARASGWLGRARRLLDRESDDSVEHGYLLATVIAEHEEAGDYEAAYATALEGAAIGERFGDRDLVALSLLEQGRLLAKQGRVEAGLALLDEVMVAVSSGELSPILTGLVYCAVIQGCQEVYELRRAREWTEALTRWCEEQPEMVSFTGRCLLHRAEILQVDGAWSDALEEARRAGRRFEQTAAPIATGEAFYRQGEIHRLRGERADAEAAYKEASRRGWEPQPGLALLRLAEGDREAAVASIRVAAETAEPVKRVGVLAALVEIMLAAGELDEARTACEELQTITAGYRGGMLVPLVAHCHGAVALAGQDTATALPALREACRAWQDLGAPYEAARARVLVGLACREVGDADTADLELDAARRVFDELGATIDLARVEGLLAAAARPGALTAREVEVVRLVATGMTNRAIAAALAISEKTVARHVSNVFVKLDVSSRSAVTAYAYEHHLV
jgi:DNA-binding CsgD family transcriptional regulator